MKTNEKKSGKWLIANNRRDHEHFTPIRSEVEVAEREKKGRRFARPSEPLERQRAYHGSNFRTSPHDFECGSNFFHHCHLLKHLELLITTT